MFYSVITSLSIVLVGVLCNKSRALIGPSAGVHSRARLSFGMRNFTEHVAQAFLRHALEVDNRGSQETTRSFISIKRRERTLPALQECIAASPVGRVMPFAAKKMQFF
jgi:hypothetical protein